MLALSKSFGLARVLVRILSILIFPSLQISGAPSHLNPSRLALNLIEGRAYLHHPVLLAVPHQAFEIRKDLVELNGLRVPAWFDCENFCHASWCPWGGLRTYRYYLDVPSRWHACHLHEAHLKSGLRIVIPELPLIDEEYDEHVSVFQSVLRARRMFVMADLGARWGTWGARAVSLLRNVNPLPYDVFFMEFVPVYCLGLQAVMRKNNINYTLVCDMTTAESFLKWARQKAHIDLIDMDIQFHEFYLLMDPEVLALVNAKVYRLVIATHDARIHAKLSYAYRDWIRISDVPVQHDVDCVQRFLRGGWDIENERVVNNSEKFDWGEILRRRCYHESVRGKVANWDGQLILDNPRFVRSHSSFTLADENLVISDLM